MAGDGGVLYLGVAILKPDPRCGRGFPSPRKLWPRGGLETTMELFMHLHPAGGSAAEAARGDTGPGGRIRAGRQAESRAALGRAGSWVRSEPAA